MKKTLQLLVVLNMLGSSIYAQNSKCGTMRHWENVKEKDPNAELRMQQLEIKTQDWLENNRGQKDPRAVITIPVVVHVLYNGSVENISDAQIFSQITALNEDFRLLNADSLKPPHPFWTNTADTEIEFCLAQQDPNGNSTTGITRTFTVTTSFTGNGDEKFDATGGKDNWNPTKYLNLWVCNLSGAGGTLGYAAFPSDLSTIPDEDGVVIDFRAFGYLGTAGTGGFPANNLGRTAAHEVGHWLNLSHIWGDTICGDDFVSDTEPAEDANYGCQSFPYNAFNTCGTGANGEMYMNFMDYVNDSCMVMFTFGQSSRMDAALFNARAGLLTSAGCSPATGISSLHDQPIVLNVYPNPSKGKIIIDIESEDLTDIRVTVNNVLGEIVFQLNQQKVNAVSNFRFDINVEFFGIYFVTIAIGDQTISKKMIINE